MRSRILIIVSLILLSVGFAFAQVSQTAKDQLVEMYKSGAFEKYSPLEIRQKLKEMGITESEALQMAKEKGIDLSKYLGGQIQGGGQMQPGGAMRADSTMGQTPQIQINTGGQVPTTPAQVETVMTLAPDTGKVARGAFGLEYFGYNVFKQIPTAFEPNNVGPVDPGYVVAPGDNLQLSVWGQTEFQYVLEVDREGRVFIPNAGQVFVSGTPLSRLQEKLKSQLSKYYSGLTSSPPTVFLDVTLAKSKPLRVFVMGEIKQPGGYTISSYATVFNALYAVGGPLQKGSLRTVKVLRENRLIATVDLYDYILKGNQTTDIRLQNNDVIFVPPRGKTASIRGEVLRPAFYELKGDEKLSTLIDFAGGMRPTAYLERAEIDRIKPFDDRNDGVEGRKVVDINLAEALKHGKSDVALFDGDDIEIYPIIDEKKNYVSIDGPVWRPGSFELSQAPTLKKLIASADGLMPKIYFPVAHIVRTNEDLITRRIIPFNLGKVMDGSSEDIKLMSRDSIILYSTEVIEVKDKYVSIFGEVKKPGKYSLRQNMTLADLILLAGGYNQEAYLLQAEVSRVRPEGIPGDTLAILLHPLLPKEFSKIASQRFTDADSMMDRTSLGTGDFLLQQRDEVLITTNPDYKEQQNVLITGDVKFPGTYSIERRGERLSRLLERAGGPTVTSYLGGAQFIRDGRRLLVDFDAAFYQKNPLHDVLMLGGDRLDIPSKPHTVIVNGEVNNPGLLSYIEGSSVHEYINRAGGLTDSSNYAVLIRPTGESQRVNFGLLRGNPDVPEGSTIMITKVPPPRSDEAHFDIGATIKDSFAILTSAATLMYLIYQVSK